MAFIQYAFLRNVWLWLHILGGAVLAKFSLWLGAEGPDGFLNVFIAAVGWEVVEFLYNTIRGWRQSGYGIAELLSPRQHFFLDAFGDVLGAMIAAATVLI